MEVRVCCDLTLKEFLREICTMESGSHRDCDLGAGELEAGILIL